MRVLLCALLLAALLAAQPPDQALEKARLLEQVERNLPEAAAAYRALADAPETPPELRATALLRLSVVLEKLGRPEEARAALAAAAETGAGEAARLAAERLAGKGGDELLAARVEVLLEELCAGDPERSNKAAADLRWIGQPGVPHLAAAVEANRQDLSRIATIVPLILSLGGPDAVAFLDRVLASPDELYRRAVVRAASRQPWVSEAARSPVGEGILRFLRDPSPAVRAEAVSILGYSMAPLELTRFMDDPDKAVQAAVIKALSFILSNQKPEDRSAVIERLVPYLNKALGGPKDVLFSAAGSFIDRHWEALLHSENGLEVCLLHLEVGSPMSTWDPTESLPDLETPAARIARIASLSRKEQAANRVRDVCRIYNLATLLPGFLKTWTRGSLAEVLRIHDEGDWSLDNRAAQRAVPAIASWLAEQAMASDYLEIFSRPDLAKAYVQSPALTAKARPEALLPHLAGLLPFAKTAPHYLLFLFKAALAVESPTVAPTVADWVERDPDIYPAAVDTLIQLKSPLAEEVMNRLLVLGNKSDSRHNMSRAQLLGNLRDSKIEGVEEHWAKAITLIEPKVDYFRISIPISFKNTYSGTTLLDFLFRRNHIFGGHFTGPIHSFSPQQQSTIISILLDNANLDDWIGLERYLKHASPEAIDIPEPVRREICIHALRQLITSSPAAAPREVILLHNPRGNWPLEDYREMIETAVENGLLDLVGSLCAIAPEAMSRYAELLFPLLSTQSPPQGVIQALSHSPDPKAFAGIRELLSHSSAPVRSEAVKGLVRIDPVRAVPLLLPLRSDPESSVRTTVLNEFLSIDQKNPEIQNLEHILPFLQDSDSSIVLTALRGFRRHLDAKHVPALVELTRSTHEDIRKSAQEILDAIRYYHEQKAFWERWLVHSGLGASAAEALVRQASPQEEKPIRLAAIASLGTLGDPEALPFLIHLMKDQDPEIAGAAKEAVVRINQRGNQEETKEKAGR